MSPRGLAVVAAAFVVGAFGCAPDGVDGTTPGTGGGSAGPGVAGAAGGTGGGSGTAGRGGSTAGSAGGFGSAGTTGNAGSGGTTGSAGSNGGSGGVGGTGGATAGQGGTGGAGGGIAGRGGAGGVAGGGGTAGQGGTGGVAGRAGTGGTGGGIAGRGGTGGAAGAGGAAGRGGTAGTGGSPCGAGQTQCTGGACVNLVNDNANCGTCGRVCPAGSSCSNSTCVCGTAGQTLCGTGTAAMCRNLNNDSATCGSCNIACATGQTCTGGTCMGGGGNGCLTNAVTGWATQGGGTTGGGSATPMVVTTASALSSALSNASVSVIELSGTVSGSFNVRSNKTLQGACGGQATINGHVGIGASTNVIVRNLRVVGLNCTDNSDCQMGDDAVEIGQSSRVWIDHVDVSDGSDGNLDIVNGSDLVTVSYSKFWYRGRSQGHQFSNLIGNSDSAPGDAGKLRVTWHHNWWADKVIERQPRVRYGQVHLYNNLWTSSGDNYCIGVGANANILSENNVFIGVSDPLETGSYSNGSSVAHAVGNIYTSTSGMTADLRGGSVFTPPYTVTLDAASGVEAAVRAGAGPK